MYPEFWEDLNEYLIETVDFDIYYKNLISFFEIFYNVYFRDVSEEEKKEDFQKFYSENMKFYGYLDIDNAEYLDYCFYLNDEPYEVFSYLPIEDLNYLWDDVLKKILKGDITFCFFDKFQKLAILNDVYTTSDKVETILLN